MQIRHQLIFVMALLLLGSSINQGAAQEPAPSVIGPAVRFAGVVRSAIGVTRQGTRIDLFLAREGRDLRSKKLRLLVVGGLAGDQASTDAVLDLLEWFYGGDATHGFHSKVTLSAIPCAHPAARQAAKPVTHDLARAYPPEGKAYHAPPRADETAYLWRWLGMHAPDLVIDLRVAPNLSWQVPPALKPQFGALLPNVTPAANAGDLIVELGRHDVCQVGRIPALRLSTPASESVRHLSALLTHFTGDERPLRASAARRELQRRLDRSPLIVAQQLSKHYGHDLKQVVYIPAIALVGQVRLGELDPQQDLQDVHRIVKPYVDGDKPSQPTSGSGLSGHLIFSELARVSQGAPRERYIELARVAADLAFDDSDRIRPIMPFHNEMSDAAFMGGPILASVGRLTGEVRYFDACARHLKSVRELVLRADGLYRHSPLDQAAWGRGNGFPALGIAICLNEFPADHPAYPQLLEHFRRHLRALAAHQDSTGCWHQVIDRPESYRELSSTCMISYAIARGLRRGWLSPAEFQPVLDRAWQAIRTRVAEDGQLVDVCTGTGKQKSLRDYYDRTAILGRDPRGGAMALLVATEMAALYGERSR